MNNKKYCIVLILFSLLLTISLINIDRNIDSWTASDKIHLSSKPMQQVLFKVGVSNGPYDLDLHNAWDTSSFYVIDQVCEGLFANDLSDPENSIIPNLALSGTWNPAGTEYTCILRQGVTFHDGALFNADAVIFTWIRLNWALNVTGTNTVGVTQFHELYEFPDGSPIVSSITKNSDYNITFVLNEPYMPFESLLCFSGSYMLSPSSTPPMAYIDTATGDLVGTGPFIYDNYTFGVEVNFHAFDNYWKGKANITEMRFQIIIDSNARHTALLTGDIHFMSAIDSAWYSTIKSSPNLTFLNTSTTSNAFYYLVMNNHLTNCTLREAISYAIDYDYIINELKDGNVERSKSPIPNGILYANDTFDVPTLNVTRARLVMQSMGFGVGLNVTAGGPDEAAWQASTFYSVTYSYNTDNQFRTDLGVLVKDNLDLIGINVTTQGMSWADFILRAYGYMEPGGYDSLGLFWIGWLSDYNDPSNIINVLFSNVSASYNSAQYDGYQAAFEAGRNPLDVNDNVQLLMEAALSEVDPVAREALYDRIQELLIEEDYPWAWGYVDYIYHAYDKHLTGFQQNSMNKFYFYPCIWNSFPILPGLFSILSDADDPDTDGDFNITWSPSVYADNYSLYAYSSLITEINGSLTLLLDEVTDLSYEASGYSDGTYYFLVVAKNGNGNTNSSNLLVNVEIPVPGPLTLSSDAGSPDTNGDFNLTWTASNFADNYSLYVYSSLITEINGSLTLLLDEVTDLSYEVFDYSDGTFYFAVVAKNTADTTLSNNIEVIVEIPVPGPLNLSSDAGSPDTDGDFNLIWTASNFANNYSLYVYSSLITEINGSLTLLLDEVTDLSYEASGYSDGTYYFAVVAKNTYGTTLSNNIEVIVEIPVPGPFTLSSDAGSPDTDGDFNLIWTASNFADNYSLYVYSSLITEINGSLTLLLDEVTGLSYDIFDYSDGTFYFLVVAKNTYGTTLSNNIEVVVEIEEPEPDPLIPGFELWTMLFAITSVGLISLLRKKKKIT